MAMITATNSFFRLCKRLAFFTIIVVFLLGGCHKSTDIRDTFGKQKDLTEDLYHRLKAGMFKVGEEPIVCQIVETLEASSLKLKTVPHVITRISWERGTFRVQSDDLGRVVIYMDEETLFSHVQVATLKGLGINLLFFEDIERPVR